MDPEHFYYFCIKTDLCRVRRYLYIGCHLPGSGWKGLRGSQDIHPKRLPHLEIALPGCNQGTAVVYDLCPQRVDSLVKSDCFDIPEVDFHD